MTDDKIVGFGKHKGLTYSELAETQKKYVIWLFKQSWFQSKYPELYEYLDLAGLRPKEISEDHNHFQALFTDDIKLHNLIRNIINNTSTYTITKVIFEHLCNADIVIEIKYTKKGLFSKSELPHVLLIELKPTVSNDYPDVLRQMRSQLHSYYHYDKTAHLKKIQQALVCKKYTGDIELENVRKMFDDIQIIIK
uniref:Uncharacterized protein n=1 Tax=Marseillevirus LCMAC102 TaxID=2506603 RepID=A0A481YVE5_9VIRU|nr:MAG: hypothetical protein LCMAC102_03190 [Marseillevirus LCMAC102]